MFPVTLEFKDGSVSTVHPPCYGFLRDEEYREDHHNYIEGSWFYSYKTYGQPSTNDRPFGNNISHSGSDLNDSELSCDHFLLENLEAIWNSGSHLPILGEKRGGKVIAHQYYGYPVQYTEDDTPRPENCIETWAKLNNVEVTTKEVMELFEKWLDKDSESCLLWHEDGFMGVKANVPCDRALFYLMLNRAFYARDESDWIHQMLDDIYIGDLSPMVAFLKTRICYKVTAGFQSGKICWASSTNDGCIFPSTLLWVGQGRLYRKPTQVAWKQHTYTSGDGHLRDEDLNYINFEGKNYSEDFNSSIFYALMGTETIRVEGVDQEADPITKEPVMNLVPEFAKRAVKPIVFNNNGGCDEGYANYWRSERLMQSMEDNNFRVSRANWNTLALKILMDE